MSTASQTPLRRRPRSIVAPKFEPSSLRLAASGLLLLLPAVMGDALFSARTEQPEPAAQVRTDRYGDLLPDGAIARLGTVRWRLGFMLRSLAYSPDSKRIAANDNRGNVLALWDAVTGKVLCRIPNVNQLLGPVFSPDGKLIATAFQSDCSLWDTATGKEVRRLKGHTNDVRGVAFSPDGKQIATGSDDGTLRLWDLATGKEQRRIECRSGRFYPLAYSPDG